MADNGLSNGAEHFNSRWRNRTHTIIFGTDTPAGRAFDVTLLWLILLSILCVVLESIGEIQASYGYELRVAEWVFTIAFSIEYILRIVSVRKARNYIFSFYGIIDLLALLPTYLDLFFSDTHYLMVIRAVRLLRVFRILKLARYLGEANELMAALRASRPKILVFLGAVLTLVLIMGTVMYLIEGPENGFTSIPRGMYWAIVTLTTVGYGDITPSTSVGQFVSSIVMIMGYGIIAVPTGIVTAELSRQDGPVQVNTSPCTDCGSCAHDRDAQFCKYCGGSIAHDP